jgi:hypothetical protein
MAEPAFSLVDEPEETPQKRVDISILALALKSLAQRTVIALESLQTLITVGLVFWLWMSIPEPNLYQIVSEGIFAVFVLAANLIVLRRK